MVSELIIILTSLCYIYKLERLLEYKTGRYYYECLSSAPIIYFSYKVIYQYHLLRDFLLKHAHAPILFWLRNSQVGKHDQTFIKTSEQAVHAISLHKNGWSISSKISLLILCFLFEISIF